jgi:hypothetical protein
VEQKHNTLNVQRERLHSRLVRIFGYSFAGTVLAIIGFFVGVPVFKMGLSALLSVPKPIPPPEQGKESIVGLVMRGETEGDATDSPPFFLFADRTHVVDGVEHLKNPYMKIPYEKKMVQYWGEEGEFDFSKNMLSMRRNVYALTESGLLIFTQEAIVDAHAKKAWGTAPVRARYTRGFLTGTGFQYDGVQERLQISGPVHITIY